VICDAGMTELVRPALYGSHHPVRALGRSGDLDSWDVDGPNCENADRLGRALPLAPVQPSGLLAVGVAGAYGAAMASNYCSRLLPPEVVIEGGRARLARRRQTLQDLLATELG
jgi:diaminopimelate decarboxylase